MDANQIASLILKRLSNELSEQESRELEQWLGENAGNQAKYNSLTDQVAFHEHMQQYGAIDESENVADWQRLVQMGLPPQQQPEPQQEVLQTRIIQRPFFRYAAVAAIALGTVITIGLWPAKQRPSAIVKVEDNQAALLPGGNRATLTLGNGEAILLDDARVGRLSRQDATDISKLDSGHLVYDVKDRLAHVSFNTITTPRGGQYNVTLPDGSHIWLNSASSVRFPTAFTGSERRVEITGEVYCDIAHNSEQPFVVVAGEASIRVMGTAFNINAYADEPSIKTTLLKGSIALSANRQSQELRLVPGDQAAIPNKENEPVKVTRLMDPERVIGWKNGYFTFDRDNLPAIMRQLARWYDLSVVYSGAPPAIEFSGKLPRNTSAVNILPILKSMGVAYRVDGKTITVLQQPK